jgi:hypothetical protein
MHNYEYGIGSEHEHGQKLSEGDETSDISRCRNGDGESSFGTVTLIIAKHNSYYIILLQSPIYRIITYGI